MLEIKLQPSCKYRRPYIQCQDEVPRPHTLKIEQEINEKTTNILVEKWVIDVNKQFKEE